MRPARSCFLSKAIDSSRTLNFALIVHAARRARRASRFVTLIAYCRWAVSPHTRKSKRWTERRGRGLGNGETSGWQSLEKFEPKRASIVVVRTNPYATRCSQEGEAEARLKFPSPMSDRDCRAARSGVQVTAMREGRSRRGWERGKATRGAVSAETKPSPTAAKGRTP